MEGTCGKPRAGTDDSQALISILRRLYIRVFLANANFRATFNQVPEQKGTTKQKIICHIAQYDQIKNTVDKNHIVYIALT